MNVSFPKTTSRYVGQSYLKTSNANQNHVSASQPPFAVRFRGHSLDSLPPGLSYKSLTAADEQTLYKALVI